MQGTSKVLHTAHHSIVYVSPAWPEITVTFRHKLLHNKKDIPLCGINFTEIIQKSLSVQSLGAFLLVKKYWSTDTATACRNNIISAFLPISKKLLQVFSLTHLDLRNKVLNLDCGTIDKNPIWSKFWLRIPISLSWELWKIKPKDLQPIGTCSNPPVLEMESLEFSDWMILVWSCSKSLGTAGFYRCYWVGSIITGYLSGLFVILTEDY